jgi:flavin-dependent dehydrogenase
VLLVERRQFPRAKPCGDCLSPAANRILTRIGVMPDVLRAGPALLEGWQLIAPDGSAFHARFNDISSDPLDDTALALRRDVFDRVLLDHAQAAGVRIMHDVQVTDVLRHADGAVAGVRARWYDQPVLIESRLTVGADGLRSIIARRLRAHARRPRLRKASFTVHVTHDSDSRMGEMRVAAGACLGIAPVEAGSGPRTHNFTLVVNGRGLATRAGSRTILREGLRTFGIAADIEGAEILASGPFDWPVRHVVCDGAALVGDAAGYYDPFTGEGIYHALAGAELLAEQASAALAGPRADRAALRTYAAEHRRLTRPARRVQRMIEFVCARPRLADLAFRRIGRRPHIARALVGVTGDIMPPRSLISPRLLMGLVT